jgi:hypothetical protein
MRGEYQQQKRTCILKSEQSENPGGGLTERIDPGEVFGYGLYSSKL